jgi:hypothetical protein
MQLCDFINIVIVLYISLIIFENLLWITVPQLWYFYILIALYSCNVTRLMKCLIINEERKIQTKCIVWDSVLLNMFNVLWLVSMVTRVSGRGESLLGSGASAFARMRTDNTFPMQRTTTTRNNRASRAFYFVPSGIIYASLIGKQE